MPNEVVNFVLFHLKVHSFLLKIPMLIVLCLWSTRKGGTKIIPVLGTIFSKGFSGVKMREVQFYKISKRVNGIKKNDIRRVNLEQYSDIDTTSFQRP